MNPEVKAKWIAALRSGEYKQGTGFLRIKDKFCCLGVLCDIAAKEGKGTWRARASDDEIDSAFDDGLGKIATLALPKSIADWAELTDTKGTLPQPVNGYFTLMDMNDKLKLSPKEIAAIIEEQL